MKQLLRIERCNPVLDYSSWSREDDATRAMNHPFSGMHDAWVMSVKATLLATQLQKSYKMGWFWHNGHAS